MRDEYSKYLYIFISFIFAGPEEPNSHHKSLGWNSKFSAFAIIIRTSTIEGQKVFVGNLVELKAKCECGESKWNYAEMGMRKASKLFLLDPLDVA